MKNNIIYEMAIFFLVVALYFFEQLRPGLVHKNMNAQDIHRMFHFQCILNQTCLEQNISVTKTNITIPNIGEFA